MRRRASAHALPIDEREGVLVARTGRMRFAERLPEARAVEGRESHVALRLRRDLGQVEPVGLPKRE